MKTPLVRINKKLSSNIVIIDGFSASGKSLVCPILSYLERKYWKHFKNFDTDAINHLDSLWSSAIRK